MFQPGAGPASRSGGSGAADSDAARRNQPGGVQESSASETTEGEGGPGAEAAGGAQGPMGRDQRGRQGRRGGGPAGRRRADVSQASGLLSLAEQKLGMGEVEQAKKAAVKAMRILRPDGNEAASVAILPALNLLAEINLELGDVDEARHLFEEAVELDPEGSIPETSGGGAEKFLWLAQLSEAGGKESVGWFERGAEVLRNDIARLGDHVGSVAEEKRKKLAGALSGIVEVYMTDLSWEDNAEATCERLIAEAMLVAPKSAETLQTLASVRISQGRIDEAKEALANSMELWRDLPPESSEVPDFATRISLARLLMEAEMEEAALEVVERLVAEDDQSVEAWYLGGWCLYLLAGHKARKGDTDMQIGTGHDMDNGNGNASTQETQHAATVSSREWLKQSLTLFDRLEYEDDRLRDHARELVEELDAVLGAESGDEEAGEGEWQSEDDAEVNGEVEDEDEDLEMEGT